MAYWVCLLLPSRLLVQFDCSPKLPDNIGIPHNLPHCPSEWQICLLFGKAECQTTVCLMPYFQNIIQLGLEIAFSTSWRGGGQ